jgi:hypothetical protein
LTTDVLVDVARDVVYQVHRQGIHHEAPALDASPSFWSIRDLNKYNAGLRLTTESESESERASRTMTRTVKGVSVERAVTSVICSYTVGTEWGRRRGPGA